MVKHPKNRYERMVIDEKKSRKRDGVEGVPVRTLRAVRPYAGEE